MPSIKVFNSLFTNRAQTDRFHQINMHRLNLISLSINLISAFPKESGSFWTNESHHGHLSKAFFEEQSWANEKAGRESS